MHLNWLANKMNAYYVITYNLSPITCVGTYNAPSTPRSATYPPGGRTLGGYTDKFVVHENFAVKFIHRNIQYYMKPNIILTNLFTIFYYVSFHFV